MGGHFGVLFSGNGNCKLGQYRIILSADTASEVRQLPERCLSRKAGIVRCCLRSNRKSLASMIQPVFRPKQPEYGLYLYLELYCLLYNATQNKSYNSRSNIFCVQTP